jgi:CMP-N-acetylneuraminic acid synthetase
LNKKKKFPAVILARGGSKRLLRKNLKEKSFFLKNNIYAFEMLKEESIDIDTEFDFKIAKALIK